jgi:manganese/iron transport system ATP-binding protein/manganese/zinc/iron transport system ATP- binding protein
MSYHRLELKDLTVSYKRVPAVHHVSLELRCGSCVGLLGPNGAGKTSLFKAMVGLVPLETGSMTFHGHDRRVTISKIAYLPQRTMVDWDFPITVRRMVEMGRYQALRWWKKFREEDRLAVDQALETMELEDLGDRQISALSGGQQQRAFLARALAQEAHVFLLDEPFSGLDKPAQDLLAGAIRRLAEAGNLLVISHHDLRTVRDLFDQVIFLNGELVAFGDADQVFTAENIQKTFQTHIFSGSAHEPDLAV